LCWFQTYSTYLYTRALFSSASNLPLFGLNLEKVI
jgi:hypothetical protein